MGQVENQRVPQSGSPHGGIDLELHLADGTEDEHSYEQPKKRNPFDELMKGFDALADQRAGKRTIRTHAVKSKPAPEISAGELTKVLEDMEDMKLSRRLFARYLRTDVRTLENWEQGRAKPNAQAVLLIRLVQRYPDTVRRLTEI